MTEDRIELLDLEGDGPAPSAPPRGPRRRLTKPVALGVAGAVVVAAVLISVNSGGGSDTRRPPTTAAPSTAAPGALSAAQQWQIAVSKDLFTLTGVAPNSLRTIDDWQNGLSTDAEARRNVSGLVPIFVQARDAIDKQAPLAGAPQALADYQAFAQLYVETARLITLAIDAPKGPLRSQLQLSYKRVKFLADRTYDAGGRVLVPFLPADPPADGVTVIPPPEVPDFGLLELEPGPPFAAKAATSTAGTTPSPPAAVPFDTWTATVAKAGIPSDSDLTTALAGTDATAMGALATRLSAASDALGAAAPPANSPGVLSGVRLALLLDAESLRAGQASVLISGAPQKALAQAVAKDLALLADHLWDQRVGARSTGYDASLLTQRQPGE